MRKELNISKKIVVNIKGKWMLASFESVGIDSSMKDEDGDNSVYFTARVSDGTKVTVNNALSGLNEQWQYFEKCCSLCSHCDVEGGDSVPYGMGSVCTPDYCVCNCPEVDEDLDDPCEEYDNGASCPYFKL